MYKQEDIDLFKKNIHKIEDEAKEIVLNTITPTRKEQESVLKIIRDYIKANKRIVYGGIAHNEAIKIKNKDDVFYGPNDYGDYDFYSFEPLKDLVAIADILHKQQFSDVYCSEALHVDTYYIRVNSQKYCDITYMPKYIYGNIPIIVINDIKYIHPHVAILDYLRMFTDPLLSIFRWEKAINRIFLLQKYYPFTLCKGTIIKSNVNNDLLNNIFNILKSMSVIFIDDYMYNLYMHISQENKFIKLTHYTVISTNYVKDIIYIYHKLKKINNKISYKEYFPFFQYTSNSIEFYLEKDMILRIFSHNDICLPYLKQNAITMNNHKINTLEDKIFVGVFPLVILYYIIILVKLIVNRHRPEANNYYNKIYELISVRNNYLTINNKTLHDKTIFTEFNIICVGKPLTLMQKKQQLKEEEYARTKRVFRVVYVPGDRKIEFNVNFANCSGNEIQKSKYSILKKYENKENKNE